MIKIIIFPGQGYQNIEMLDSTTQEFCIKYNLYTELNEVLKDHKKIFNTKYAQPLIVATQLAEFLEYRKKEKKDTKYIFVGFSLGEITALIASGTISIQEGLEFAKQRGKICEEFAKKSNKEFSVAKISKFSGIEERISEFNREKDILNHISITNYIPTKDTISREYITITGETDNLRKNIDLFGGNESQKMAVMQCPFHSMALKELMPIQEEAFKRSITEVNTECLTNVICTRTGKPYKVTDIINRSLSEYLIEPIQTKRTLNYINITYPNNDLIVTMGEAFSKSLELQYSAIGGKDSKVKFIKNEIKTLLYNYEKSELKRE